MNPPSSLQGVVGKALTGKPNQAYVNVPSLHIGNSGRNSDLISSTCSGFSPPQSPTSLAPSQSTRGMESQRSQATWHSRQSRSLTNVQAQPTPGGSDSARQAQQMQHLLAGLEQETLSVR